MYGEPRVQPCLILYTVVQMRLQERLDKSMNNSFPPIKKSGVNIPSMSKSKFVVMLTKIFFKERHAESWRDFDV